MRYKICNAIPVPSDGSDPVFFDDIRLYDSSE